jgi:hypothetical protein
MAIKRTDIIVPEILERAVRGAFKGMKALYGSAAAIIRTGMPQNKGGDKVKVPYFGNLGEWEDVAEGVPLSLAGLTEDADEAVVQRTGKAFEATDWASLAADPDSDPYTEAARQLAEGGQRRMDKALIDAALTSSLVLDVYNAGAPRTLDYDLTIDGQAEWGDEMRSAALLITHSKQKANLLKQKDSQGRPLYTDMSAGSIERVGGMGLMVSDRCPVEFPTITATGTTPPAVTVTGTTSSAINKLRIEITTLGARGTAVFRYSFNGGSTWTSLVVTAATVDLLLNGSKTGLTVNFAVGNYALDNVYVGTPKYTTILALPGSLVVWMNGNPTVETDRDILTASTVASVNAYFAAHRYRRSASGSTQTGIVLLKHN